MLQTLRDKKTLLKNELTAVEGMRFRKINDPEGECATVLTVIFDSVDIANDIARKLSSKTTIESGWHVYSNMTQIGESRTPVKNWPAKARFATPGVLSQTDDILARSFSISIGVVDNGLGTGFGINILSSETDIKQVAREFMEAVKS